jgi:hypothetical protein
LGQIKSSNVKRFGIVSDKFRNRKDGFDDKVMLVLWVVELSFCCSAELRGIYGEVECMILVGGGVRNRSYVLKEIEDGAEKNSE